MNGELNCQINYEGTAYEHVLDNTQKMKKMIQKQMCLEIL